MYALEVSHDEAIWFSALSAECHDPRRARLFDPGFTDTDRCPVSGMSSLSLDRGAPWLFVQKEVRNA
jgi:hypothetical protein